MYSEITCPKHLSIPHTCWEKEEKKSVKNNKMNRKTDKKGLSKSKCIPPKHVEFSSSEQTK